MKIRREHEERKNPSAATGISALDHGGGGTGTPVRGEALRCKEWRNSPGFPNAVPSLPAPEGHFWIRRFSGSGIAIFFCPPCTNSKNRLLLPHEQGIPGIPLFSE